MVWPQPTSIKIAKSYTVTAKRLNGRTKAGKIAKVRAAGFKITTPSKIVIGGNTNPSAPGTRKWLVTRAGYFYALEFLKGSVDPVIVKPAAPKPPPPKPTWRITIALKDWTGPAGRTFIQGLHWDPINRCWFIIQADNVAGAKEQSIVIRRHTAEGTYRDRITLGAAGHGSTLGLVCKAGVVEWWVGHATWGPGFVTNKIGDTAWKYTKVPCLPKGDISIDQAADLVCVRAKNRYRGYRLSAARAGKAILLFDFRIADWFNRFQGHLVIGGRLYVHRDVATKGQSRVRSYSLSPKQVIATKTDEWDSTNWGDEAEGLMVKDGWVWSVSRIGNSGPGRTVRATPICPVEYALAA